MLVTGKIIEKGRSSRGGWGFRQLALLGVPIPLVKGWKKRLIGKNVSEEKVRKFIALKDAHLRKGNIAKPKAGSRHSCSPQYTKTGIKKSIQTAKLLRDLYNYALEQPFVLSGLSQEESDFVNKMLCKFSWSPEETESINRLHREIFRN